MQNESRIRTSPPWFSRPLMGLLLAVAALLGVLALFLRDEAPGYTSPMESNGTPAPATVPHRSRGTPPEREPSTPADEPEIVAANVATVDLVVQDELSGKPLPGVEVSVETSNTVAVNAEPHVTDEMGRLRLPPEVLSQLSNTMDVRLPPDLGGVQLQGRLLEEEHGPVLTVPAYARIVATLQRGDGSEAVERPKKGKLWVATWPTPEQALGIENPAIQSSGLRAWYEMRALHSETTSWRINVDYHSRLAKQPGVDESQLQVVGVDFVQDKDMVVDLPYAGEVVADLFLPGFGVQKRTAQVRRGIVTSIAFDPPTRRTLLVEVTDPEGRPIPGAVVTVVVRREVLAGELVPATAFSVFTPNGTEKRLAFGKSIVQASASGKASVGLGFLGDVFVSANKEGFIPLGRVVLTGRTPPTSKPVRLSLQPIPPETPKVTFRVKGVPVGKLKFVLADLQPQDQFFELPLGSHETDENGRANLGMLSPGRLYGVSMAVGNEQLARGFIYKPGMIIDMDDKSGMRTVNPGRK